MKINTHQIWEYKGKFWKIFIFGKKKGQKNEVNDKNQIKKILHDKPSILTNMNKQ